MKDPYKRIARWYDTIFEPLNSGLRAIGMKMYPAKAGMQVIDIGCGTGAQLRRYKDSQCEIFGIDTSAAMIGIAKKKLGPEACLTLGDASKTSYPDDNFDIVIFSTVLHEMSAEVRINVLNEAKRIVKNEGRILLIDFHPGPIKGIKGWISKFIISLAELGAGRIHHQNYRHFIKNGGLLKLIDDCGIEVEQEKIVGGGTFAIYIVKKL
jgi:ubiquinone/menaquinone biosynthesis C-methylase UbiE